MFAYTGSFTTAKRKARGKGISVYRIDASGAWSLIEVLEAVTNEDSDTIVAFRLDKDSGKPTPTGLVIATGSPSCIASSS